MPRIFLNPQSGAHTSEEANIRALFPRCDITPLAQKLNLRTLAQSDPIDRPWIAAGGDGTVNTIAQAVCGTARPFGVLPLGTLNHFARDLNIPLDLTGAARIILEGHTRPIDAAEVSSQNKTWLFVNNSSLGAYPAMVLDRDRQRRSGRGKWAALVTASMRAFLRFRTLTVDMSADGRHLTCITPFLFVGNNEYCLDGSVGLPLGQRKDLDRGTLALYLAPGATRPAVLRMALAALVGRLKRTPEYQEHLVSAFTVHVRGRRRLRVSLDGEVRRLTGPLTYTTLPAALNVLTPPLASEN